ncbi:MAG: hypothetical protein CK431_16995 [Mycobacterium sp.]|nr:MAG: hypothetical protein CK431_16995 [Mycobacterium sp.]
MADDDAIDIVREALQVRVNEAGYGGLVVHFVALIGLYDEATSRMVVIRPDGQADYITHGLIACATETLAAEAELAASDTEEE